VIVSDPFASVVVEILATPPTNVAAPSALVPDLNVTDPVGTPEVVAVTVALNVTDCPAVDGFCDELSNVLVPVLFTTCDTAAEVLAAWPVSPLYTTVMLCVPTVSADVASDAAPPAKFCVPNVAVPFLNVTVPVGVPPELDVTVALNVTLCPKLEGFALDATVVAVVYLFTVSVKIADVLARNVVSPA
jgi:hypothetical protein